MPALADWGSIVLAGLTGLFFGAAVAQSNLALSVFGAAFALWLAFGVRELSRPGRIVAGLVFVAGLLTYAAF